MFSSTSSLKKMAQSVADLLGGQADFDDEVDACVIRAVRAGRRVELNFDLDDDYPELEITIVLDNKLGQLDLYYDEDEEDMRPDDSDFDFETKMMQDGLYLIDLSRNVQAQARIMERLPQDFWQGAAAIMKQYGLDNIDFDMNYAFVAFEGAIDQDMEPGEAITLLDAVFGLLTYFEA